MPRRPLLVLVALLLSGCATTRVLWGHVVTRDESGEPVPVPDAPTILRGVQQGGPAVLPRAEPSPESPVAAMTTGAEGRFEFLMEGARP